MKFGLIIFSVFIFSTPIISQNILADSTDIAVFADYTFIKTDGRGTRAISGGIIFGGMFDFIYQHGNGFAPDPMNNPGKVIEFTTSAFIIDIVLTRKKLLATLDISFSSAQVEWIDVMMMGIGLSLAKKYELTEGFDACVNISPGLFFNLEEFPEQQEFGLAANAILLLGGHLYFGPGIGYAGKKSFVGFSIGFILPFADRTGF